MATEPASTQLPPVHDLVGEVVATLAMAAHAYLEPEGESAADLHAAETALDVAGFAYERIRSEAPTEVSSALARLLTETRMTFVRKRGQ